MGCVKSVCGKKDAWKTLSNSNELGRVSADELEKFYKVETKVLGAGSYAKVYRAVEIKTNQIVAVKRIRKEGSRRDLLDSEITILRRFGNHRHIVRLFACFETETEVQLVMEYLPGGELFDALDQNGAYGESDAARHVKAVASGLEYLHKNLVVHRDLKPENLLLTAKAPAVGTLKISDFGLARMLKEGESMGKAAGTWAYSAPEVLLVRRNGTGGYDVKCDMFSLGVLTFVILAGYHPFDPDGDRPEQEMQDAIVNGKWDFNDMAWDGVSAEAKELITLLLEPDPVERLSATAALKHHWTSGVSPYGSLSGSISEDIRAYRLRERQKQLKAGLLAAQSVFRLKAQGGHAQGKTKASRHWDRVRSAWKSGELSRLSADTMHKVVKSAHHRWLRSSNTPELGKPSRRDMIVRIYRALDFDSDGYLSEVEMFRFAKFKDYPGDRSEWQQEYESLCEECGWASDVGVDFQSFELLLNTQECNFYNDDASLGLLVQQLTGQNAKDTDELSSSLDGRSSQRLEIKKKKSTKKITMDARTSKKTRDSSQRPTTRGTCSVSTALRESMFNSFDHSFHASKSETYSKSTPLGKLPEPPVSPTKKAKAKPTAKPRTKTAGNRLAPDHENGAQRLLEIDTNEEPISIRKLSSEKLKSPKKQPKKSQVPVDDSRR